MNAFVVTAAATVVVVIIIIIIIIIIGYWASNSASQKSVVICLNRMRLGRDSRSSPLPQAHPCPKRTLAPSAPLPQTIQTRNVTA